MKFAIEILQQQELSYLEKIVDARKNPKRQDNELILKNLTEKRQSIEKAIRILTKANKIKLGGL